MVKIQNIKDNDGYSDGTIMTSCARPGGYRPASEIKSTSGDNNDTDGTTYPGAPEICGDNKDNNQNGQTDESCCNVSVSVSPNEVWPRNAGSTETTSTITISMTNPAPPTGCTVSLSVEPFNLSGGHVHYGNRPKGTIEPASVSFSDGESGALWTSYTSSEIAGEEKIITKVNGNIINEITIKVRVPDLQAMPVSGEGHWRLTGSYGEPGVTSQHFENHYGTPSTKARIAAMASDYFEDTGTAIGINDMSLPWGGLFDIENNWSSNPGHVLHRVGRSVDIDRANIDVDRLTRIAKKYNGRRIPEATIHYEFP